MESLAYKGPVDVPEAVDAWIMASKVQVPALLSEPKHPIHLILVDTNCQVPPITFLNPDNAGNVLRRHFARAVVLALNHGEISSLRRANEGVVKSFREVGFQYHRGVCVSPSLLPMSLFSGYCYLPSSESVFSRALFALSGGSMSPKFLVIDLQDRFLLTCDGIT